MKILAIGILLVTALLTACNSSRTEQEESSVFTSLRGKNFMLTVNKTAKLPKVTTPSEELKESDYVTSTEGKVYTVSFLADGSKVTLEPGTIRGDKTETADKSLCYFTLTSGVFAGGRFEVRIKPTGFEGELTIYGSGLPIILSERGGLLPGN